MYMENRNRLTDIQNSLVWGEQNSGHGIKDTNSMHKIDKEKGTFYSKGNFSHFLVITYYAVLKCWLKAQHSENEDHGIRSHHFLANRWRNNGNSERLYFFGLQNHCRW